MSRNAALVYVSVLQQNNLRIFLDLGSSQRCFHSRGMGCEENSFVTAFQDSRYLHIISAKPRFLFMTFFGISLYILCRLHNVAMDTTFWCPEAILKFGILEEIKISIFTVKIYNIFTYIWNWSALDMNHSFSFPLFHLLLTLFNWWLLGCH